MITSLKHLSLMQLSGLVVRRHNSCPRRSVPTGHPRNRKRDYRVTAVCKTVFSAILCISHVFAMDVSRVPVQQTKTVSGKVTNSEQQPLPGVTVSVKGTARQTATDSNGQYAIADIPDTSVLVFSILGMKTQERSVSGLTTLDVQMEEETILLEEMVAVGYGKVMRKEELTGSIATVEAAMLANKAAPSTINLLQGAAAGVTVNQDVSYPGMAGSIKVRETSSWQGSSQPLFVIDGIISTTADFSRLSPADIESISVLKDAASAAIYGMRAGNGVILVTTKQGNLGKVQMTYQTSYGMQSPTSRVGRPSTYTQALLNNDAFRNWGAADDNPGMYTQDELDYFKNNSFDPLEGVLGNPAIQTHDLTMSGGAGDTRYYISGSYLNQDGYTRNYNFNKYSLLAKLDGKINQQLSFNLTLNLAWNGAQQPYFNGDGDQRQETAFGWMVATAFNRPNYINGSPVYTGENMVQIINGEAGFSKPKSNLVKPIFKLKYQVPFVQGLSVSGVFSYNNTYDYMKRFVTVPKGYAFKMTGGHGHIYSDEIDTSQGVNGLVPIPQTQSSIGGANNQLNVNTSRNYGYNLQFLADYERTIGKHTIAALAGYEQWETWGDYLNAWGRNYVNTNYQEINGADPDVIHRQPSGSQMNLSGQSSYFGRLDYNYDRKYMLGFTFRADGTYIFPPDSRWGYFPAGSVAWNVSEEHFFEPLKPYVSGFKIRAAYGLTGSSAVSPWQWQQSYNYFSSINYILDGAISAGTGIGGVINPDITWEKNSQLDLGLDITFFDRLGSLSVGYWQKKTTDILAPRTASTPNTVGAVLPDVNYGEAAARGFELVLGHDNAIGAFRYGISGNLAFSSNKYLKIDQAHTVRDYENLIGHPVAGRIMGFHSEGIIRSQADVDRILAEHGDDFTIFGYKPQPGMLMYTDLRGPLGVDGPDGKIDNYDLDYLSNNGIPRISYGFNVNAAWKGLALDLSFAGFARYTGVVDQYHGRKPYAVFGVWFDMWEDFWTPENPNASMPDPTWHDWIKGYNIDPVSTFWLQNRNFLRLKYVNLSYTVPTHLVNHVGLKGATVFMGGENLLTFSKYYLDPEQAGIRMLPVLKSFTLGAKITF